MKKPYKFLDFWSYCQEDAALIAEI
jgi:hypothetical protein